MFGWLFRKRGVGKPSGQPNQPGWRDSPGLEAVPRLDQLTEPDAIEAISEAISIAPLDLSVWPPYQPPELHCAPEVQELLDQSRKLLQWHAQYMRQSRPLAAFEQAVGDATLSVAFVGEFNSGKSSLLNLFSMASVLPTGRFPETGVVCHIALGPSQAVAARFGASWRPVGISVEEIRALTSLTRSGQRIDHSAIPDEIRICTPDLHLPAGAVLIDTPGFNDDPEMTERALAAAKSADLVVWVLNSRQFLSTVEQDLIADLAARRGNAGIGFVVNVFLEGSDEHSICDDWFARQQEDLPVQIAKLSDLTRRLGMECPPLLAVSAKAAMEIDRVTFGAEQLQNDLLDQICEHRAALIACRQMSIALAELRPIRTGIDTHCKKLASDYRTQELRWTEFKQAVEKRNLFLREVRDIALEGIDAWMNQALAIANEMAGVVTTDNLKRDDTYTTVLKNALVETASEIAGHLREHVLQLAQAYGQTLVSRPPDTALAAKLLILPPDIVVPNNGFGGSVLGGAAAGAAVGSFVPILGTGIGALIGGVVGAVGGGREALAKDITELRLNITAAGTAAVETMRANRDGYASDIVAMYQVGRPSEPDQLDAKPLDHFRKLLEHINIVIDRLEQERERAR